MSNLKTTTPRGTDFSSIRMLLSHGENYQPRPGDVVDLGASDLEDEEDDGKLLPRMRLARVVASNEEEMPTLQLQSEGEEIPNPRQYRLRRGVHSYHVEESPAILEERDIHWLNTLRLRPGVEEGRRRVIVFWIVDPDVYIPSTREVPPQQGVIPYEEALAIRLELMEERRLHKTSFNPRVVSLCEH
ncbi:MAG: DUF4246 family protein [Myxococcales bacterium]|nr:DUF4246 domain-containing protein [Polyangiaceae bacterium]MDW8248728.1 DUF4246 family protein [Myxococcales bacterium]